MIKKQCSENYILLEFNYFFSTLLSTFVRYLLIFYHLLTHIIQYVLSFRLNIRSARTGPYKLFTYTESLNIFILD